MPVSSQRVVKKCFFLWLFASTICQGEGLINDRHKIEHLLAFKGNEYYKERPIEIIRLCDNGQGVYGVWEASRCWVEEFGQWQWEPEGLPVPPEQLGSVMARFQAEHPEEWASNNLDYLCHQPRQGRTTFCLHYADTRTNAAERAKRQDAEVEETSFFQLSTEEIVGIVFGSAAAIVLIVMLITCIKKGGGDVVMGALISSFSI